MIGVNAGRVFASRWLEPGDKKLPISTLPSKRFWPVAALAIAGTLGVASRSEAAVSWSDPDTAVSRPLINTSPRAQHARRQKGKEKQAEQTVKEAAKPQGALIIAVSINKQNVKIYDTNGFFAEAPVSTGMPGHATPMGAFSIIQKQKMHHSNIYSGAPMPFMERITWSGVAMHAGVLPGHPASHGCIRMPMAFAVKMYGWTRMGARVIVTPGDVTPANFSHPLLAAVRVVPQPVAVEETKADVVAARTPEKLAPVAADTAAAETRIELRSTVGHVGAIKSTANESHPQSPSSQVKTADASGAL